MAESEGFEPDEIKRLHYFLVCLRVLPGVARRRFTEGLMGFSMVEVSSIIGQVCLR